GVVRDNIGWIEPGLQKLNGVQALWYARSRILSDDFSRMRRQRCLIGALLDQVNPVNMLRQYPELAQAAKENISTDIAVEQLPAWVELVQRIQKGAITSLTFTSDNINPANPNYPKMREMVQAAINPPPAAETPTPSTTAPSTSTTPKSTKVTTTSPTSTPTLAGGVVDVRNAC
ncbi:MAG TPA: LCP family protein, partial [Lapillicoccus sp.]|nr:LCP family protein [Lapillicoccus sp.]